MKYIIDFTKLNTNSSYVFCDYVRKAFPFYDKEGVFSINGETHHFSEYDHNNLFEFLSQFQNDVVEIEYFESESIKYLKQCEEENKKIRDLFRTISSTDEFKESLKSLIEGEM